MIIVFYFRQHHNWPSLPFSCYLNLYQSFISASQEDVLSYSAKKIDGGVRKLS
ncbi:hypothetical protein EZV62_006450 [Acer yangbiense]|uniref:Uncharacterized protein n=1 Tax=Acer yangbiense TaxID=1000413 RepID=A0A5C7I7M4_9ROSI|nr:hypothetical protein EZV62_006450 [Acer yangbiense]